MLSALPHATGYLSALLGVDQTWYRLIWSNWAELGVICVSVAAAQRLSMHIAMVERQMWLR